MRNSQPVPGCYVKNLSLPSDIFHNSEAYSVFPLVNHLEWPLTFLSQTLSTPLVCSVDLPGKMRPGLRDVNSTIMTTEAYNSSENFRSLSPVLRTLSLPAVPRTQGG